MGKEDECWTIGLLEEYTDYHFVNPKEDEESKCVFYRLCHEYFRALTVGQDKLAKQTFLQSLPFAWQHAPFFLKIFIKSLALYIVSTQEKNGCSPVTFSDGFYNILKSLIMVFAGKMKDLVTDGKKFVLRQFNVCISLFFKDLLHLLDHNYVFKLVKTFCFSKNPILISFLEIRWKNIGNFCSKLKIQPLKTKKLSWQDVDLILLGLSQNLNILKTFKLQRQSKLFGILK